MKVIDSNTRGSARSGAIIVLVCGSGDIGSAVAHALFRAGCAPVIHDHPAPAATRRKMAFTDALFDGKAWLAGVEACRVDDIVLLRRALHERQCLPVTSADLALVLDGVRPEVLVDARMRKRHTPEEQCGLATLTIGLGPNFTAGRNVHLAVETAWGEALGRLVEDGPTQPLRGEPRPIGGHARERYIYAPVNGTFLTTCEVGDSVEQGQIVATIAAIELRAPITGRLRGLTHNGVEVTAGTKVIEVDPRGPAAEIDGIGERPRHIAAGVLRALRQRALLDEETGTAHPAPMANRCTD